MIELPVHLSTLVIEPNQSVMIDLSEYAGVGYGIVKAIPLNAGAVIGQVFRVKDGNFVIPTPFNSPQ